MKKITCEKENGRAHADGCPLLANFILTKVKVLNGMNDPQSSISTTTLWRTDGQTPSLLRHREQRLGIEE